jgi:hypothetical protein
VEVDLDVGRQDSRRVEVVARPAECVEPPGEDLAASSTRRSSNCAAVIVVPLSWECLVP